MPSFDHEILVDLFREDGRLAPELLRRCAGITIEHTRVEHRSIDLSGLPEDLSKLYYDVILRALPAELRRRLEARMVKGYRYQSDFARTYYGQGLEEGREQGREDGLRAAIVALARTKLKTVSPEDLARIAALTNVRVLTDLVSALGQARTAFGARIVLARALRR